jgi:hypothetical protein
MANPFLPDVRQRRGALTSQIAGQLPVGIRLHHAIACSAVPDEYRTRNGRNRFHLGTSFLRPNSANLRNLVSIEGRIKNGD